MSSTPPSRRTSDRLETLFSLAALTILPWSASAGVFEGPYVITDDTHLPGIYDFSTTLGNWTATVVDGGEAGAAYVDTTFAPNTVGLYADGPFVIFGGTDSVGGARPHGLTQTVSAEISMFAPLSGQFSMDYSVEVGNEILAFDEQGMQNLVGNGTVNLSLTQGELFGFRVISDIPNIAAAARPGLMGPGLAGLGIQLVFLSNPTFSNVPEASTVWAGAALTGFVFWSWRRSRRHLPAKSA